MTSENVDPRINSGTLTVKSLGLDILHPYFRGENARLNFPTWFLNYKKVDTEISYFFLL